MTTHCCALREYFVVAVVGVTKNIAPIEIGDYVTDFHNEHGRMTIGFKFCPWCGVKINHEVDPIRITTPTQP